jgi:SpoVK/Ycf46/Vps4 family AAA+-type ATPase
MRLDPASLYDRYIGESEGRLRDALRQAEAMSPVVLWIDEIEKGFAGASSTSTDGGLSRRMFGSMLTWMQDHKKPVFLVATANDIEALPPELIRKGRFDEVFFVDLPGPDVRKMIFGIHLRKRKQDASKVDLAKLGAASDGFSGSEIEQVVISALHRAVSRRGDAKTPVVLTTDLLMAALSETRPLSVTMAEKVEALREWARGRCVPAD